MGGKNFTVKCLVQLMLSPLWYWAVQLSEINIFPCFFPGQITVAIQSIAQGVTVHDFEMRNPKDEKVVGTLKVRTPPPPPKLLPWI